MKKVLLVARDIAPSRAFELLATELTNRGHDPILLIGKGKPMAATTEDIQAAVQMSDVVVVGMSSSAALAEPELVACATAVTTGKSFGFYGDTFGCHERARDGSWFGPYRSRATFFFAVNNNEMEKAKKVLIGAKTIVTGNPTWEDYAFPRFTRSQIRDKLKIRDDELFILAPGGKDPVVNIMVWGLLLDALTGWPKERPVRVLFTCHPGDRTMGAIDPAESTADKQLLRIYNGLTKFSPVMANFNTSEMSSSDLIPGIDLLIDWGSSIGIKAAHQRRPCISVATEIGRQRLQSTTGARQWKLCVLGTSIEVPANSSDLKAAIARPSKTDSPEAAKLRARQAIVFPQSSARGKAVGLMATNLELIVGK